MRLGSVAFLVALGGLASSLPKQMAAFSSLAGQPAASAPGGLEAKLEADVARRLEAQGVDGAAELVRQARGEQKTIRNPLIDVLLGQGPAAKAAMTPRLPALPTGWRPAKSTVLWASSAATWGPVLLLGLAVVLAIIDLKGAARALAGLCHWSTRSWLILLSVAAPGLRYLWRIDVWGTLPSELCWAPAAAVLVSAAILRQLDLNEPVWNKTVLALSAPVVSGLAAPLLN
ncbi:hypothetical protein EPO15_06415 [bacterium]|nr:MAG: hypothetical protein EPO15_06415 [bacterium]